MIYGRVSVLKTQIAEALANPLSYLFDTVANLNVSTDNPGELLGVDFDRKTGLGDTVLWTALSPIRHFVPKNNKRELLASLRSHYSPNTTTRAS